MAFTALESSIYSSALIYLIYLSFMFLLLGTGLFSGPRSFRRITTCLLVSGCNEDSFVRKFGHEVCEHSKRVRSYFHCFVGCKDKLSLILSMNLSHRPWCFHSTHILITRDMILLGDGHGLGQSVTDIQSNLNQRIARCR